MKPNSIYPVIGTDKIVASRDFYTRYFDFDIVFAADWYVSLKSRSNPNYELALLDYRHQSLPEAYRQPARGIVINVELPVGRPAARPSTESAGPLAPASAVPGSAQAPSGPRPSLSGPSCVGAVLFRATAFATRLTTSIDGPLIKCKPEAIRT